MTLAVPTRAAMRKGSAHPDSLRWLLSFGALGLFAVAFVDASPIPLPLPGSSDLILLLLVSHQANAFGMAAVAVAGSLAGAFFTWTVTHKGGEAMLKRYVPARIRTRVDSWVKERGMLTITLAALLPPPIPLTPFVVAAGALGMPRTPFLLSFGCARTLRYGILAWLGAHYGRQIVGLFNRYMAGWSSTILWIYCGLVAAGIVFGVWKFLRTHNRHTLPAEPAHP